MPFVLPPRTDPPRELATEPNTTEPNVSSVSRWPGVRDVIEGLACLAMAVLVMRSFFVEGYMISTGSMAPALLGYHKRIVCPTCGALFARGVAFDDSHASGDIDATLLDTSERAVCPNCGESAINIAEVPRNHGDQLLVFKHLFGLRSPERWEIAVFHNPSDPTQAFVKRIVGLPGEAVQVVEGNVYVDGEICRKSLAIQRAMRIPVFLSEHSPPKPPHSALHWIGRDGWSADAAAGLFQFDRSNGPPSRHDASLPRWSWLAYRHRASTPGERVTSVAVANLPLGFALPESPFVQPVTFRPDADEPDAGTLSVTGPLSHEWEERLRDLSAGATFQSAVNLLAQESRHPAITDDYGYNDLREGGRNAVSDLMITGRLRLEGNGQFAIEMSDGQRRFRLVFDTRNETLSLFPVDSGGVAYSLAATGHPTESAPDLRLPTPDSRLPIHADASANARALRSAPLPATLARGESVTFEMSVMDRQVLVAIDGEQAFPAWIYELTEPLPPDGEPPVRLGARGLTASVRDLNLYRDIYYTPGRRRNGITEPCVLDEGEFFVLGDNSPVSLDSRSWVDPAVPGHLLIGKPFVVHLPSRPATLRIGSSQFTVRVPDFPRVRFLE